ncbi:MAG: cache domain-containing protein [Anaerolineales bacterium]
MKRKRVTLSHIVRGIGVFCILIGAGLSSTLTFNYLKLEKADLQASKDYAFGQLDDVAKYVDEEMDGQKRAAENLAKFLATAPLNEENLHSLMQNTISNQPSLHGVVIAFVPNILPDKEEYAPYYYLHANGERDFTQIESVYHYTDSSVPSAIWYTNTAKERQGQWYNYYGKVADDWIIVYATPFYRKDPVTGESKFYGVIATSHSINSTFHQFFQYIPLGKDGYTVLMNENGKIVFHPKRKYIGKTVLQVAEEMDDPVLRTAQERLLNEDKFVLERVAANGRKSWTIFKKLPSSNWHIAVVVNQDVISIPGNEKTRTLINISLGVLIFLIGLSTFIFQPEKRSNLGIWGFSISLGFLSLLGIAWVWYLVYTNPSEPEANSALVNQQDISNYLSPFEDSDVAKTRGMPTRIPTGLIVESLSLTNRTALFSGYVWQKFPIEMDENEIQPPHFVNEVSAANARETYRFIQNGKRVVGWFITVELREYFDVSRYPLDEITARLEIEPSNLSKNMILVPDIDSYEYMSPEAKPGLASEGMIVPGWNVRESYFIFKDNNFNADFGSLINVRKNEYPALLFNIYGTRNLISPLIAYCIVIIVILVQIFRIVMIRVEEPLEVLSVGAALFLVNAISHNALRGELAASGTVYLEYFFIFLYVTILASSINGLSRTLGIKLKILQERDNILAKALFWPLYFGVAFIFTLLVFY